MDRNGDILGIKFWGGLKVIRQYITYKSENYWKSDRKSERERNIVHQVRYIFGGIIFQVFQ